MIAKAGVVLVQNRGDYELCAPSYRFTRTSPTYSPLEDCTNEASFKEVSSEGSLVSEFVLFLIVNLPNTTTTTVTSTSILPVY